MLFLVVDDDALSRDLLTLVLEAEGYEVETAASGEAALARIACCAMDGATLPDVLLTDLQMPGTAGNALAKSLREALGEGTPILAMSGSQPPASELASFDGFLRKPFKMCELRLLISTIGLSQVGLPSMKPEGPGGYPPQEKTQANASGLEPVCEPICEIACEPIDEEIYAKMCDLMPAAQLGQMYALCVGDARKRIAHMQALASTGDDAGYRSEAHAVKGGCGMIGASELHQLAAVAEQAGLTPAYTPPETTSRTILGTIPIPAMLERLALACDRLERIVETRTQEE